MVLKPYIDQFSDCGNPFKDHHRKGICPLVLPQIGFDFGSILYFPRENLKTAKVFYG